ncbi:MAG: hypothetical protein ACOC5K_01605 [Chloroflexota bacterium]
MHKPEGPWALNYELKTVVREKFNFDPNTANQLRYVQRGSKLPWNSDPTLVRVYDPRLMSAEAVVDGFDSVPASSNALVFEGVINQDGSVELEDRRPVKTPEA